MASHTPRKLPPIWLLGLSNLPLGIAGGLGLLTIPQLLASRHVPEPTIAGITALALAPTFLVFLTGPVLDVKFSRRTYAVAATILCFMSTAAALTWSSNLYVLGTALVLSLGFAGVNNVAVGGWLGTLVSKKDDATLGAWMQVANTLGFGLVSIVGIQVIRAVPPAAAAVLLSAPILLPLLIYAVTPAPGPDVRLAQESFSRFFRDLAALVRRPVVLQLIALFAVPAASFALTNTLGGLGREYHTSEAFVAVVGGAAVTLAGLFGSLIVPPLARRTRASALYLSIGALGGLFTLSLIVLPHTPALFATAMVGQNIAQSAALSASTVIALQSLGEDNPFAATQYGLLICAAALPITYMQLVDGHAYGAGGLTLMYLADGGLGVVACTAMALLLSALRRRRRSKADGMALQV